MKSKRILFVLFTCVFALYGCMNTGAYTSTNIANNEVSISMNVNDMPEVFQQAAKRNSAILALQAYAKDSADTRMYTDVRDTKGIIVTKNDFKQLANRLLSEAKDKKAKADELAKQRAQLVALEQDAIGVFYPRITTYGLDCYGCQSVNGRGGTAMGVMLDLNMGVQQPDGSWQPGIKYGNYYIIAADRSVPMCSIVEISDHGLGGYGLSPDQPFYAMVLDRGGGISGSHFDLYKGSEANSQVYRVQTGNPKARIIRMGGQNASGGCAI